MSHYNPKTLQIEGGVEDTTGLDHKKIMNWIIWGDQYGYNGEDRDIKDPDDYEDFSGPTPDDRDR